MPIAWFPVKRCPAAFISAIIREALIRTYELGMVVKVVTMDGTQHNISAFNLECPESRLGFGVVIANCGSKIPSHAAANFSPSFFAFLSSF